MKPSKIIQNHMKIWWKQGTAIGHMGMPPIIAYSTPRNSSTNANLAHKNELQL